MKIATWYMGISRPSPLYGKEGDFFFNSSTDTIFIKRKLCIGICIWCRLL